MRRWKPRSAACPSDHGVVLLPARAVAAGAPDLTPEVEDTLAAILARGRAEGSALQPGDGRWSATRPMFGLKTAVSRRRHIALGVMIALAALWLVAASRVHVNASWSDQAWGYAAFPLFGRAPEGRRPGAVRARRMRSSPRFRISRPCAACRG